MIDLAKRKGAIIILIGIRLDTNTTSRMRVGSLLPKSKHFTPNLSKEAKPVHLELFKVIPCRSDQVRPFCGVREWKDFLSSHLAPRRGHRPQSTATSREMPVDRKLMPVNANSPARRAPIEADSIIVCH